MVESVSNDPQVDVPRLEALLNAALAKSNEESARNIELRAEINVMRSQLEAYQLALDEASKKISALETSDVEEDAESLDEEA